MNDDELRALLRTWKAPSTPRSIETRVMAAIAQPPKRVWWPVALAAAAAILLAVLLIQRSANGPGTLADFKPVKELQPRVIKSTFEEVNLK